MAITIKTIGGQKYAYLAYRRGKKVVQEYLGSAKDPAVIAQMSALDRGKTLPSHLHALFWDVDLKTVSVRQHSRYIIERILDVGDLNAFWWAQRQYPTSMIIEVLHASRRISERSKIFWSTWFGVENAS